MTMLLPAFILLLNKDKATFFYRTKMLSKKTLFTLYHDERTIHTSQHSNASRETDFVLPGCAAFYVEIKTKSEYTRPG
jgi:hypothetical protein